MSVLLEYMDFSSWLCEQDWNEYVGRSFARCNCPIANWLNETRGGTWAVDGSSAYDLSAKEYRTPVYHFDQILVEFIEQVDGIGQTGNGDWTYPLVTAAQCTHILSRIVAAKLGKEGYA